MQKRELAVGSAFVFILLCCLLSYFADILNTYQRNGISLPPTLVGDQANAIAIVVFLSGVGQLWLEPLFQVDCFSSN